MSIAPESAGQGDAGRSVASQTGSEISERERDLLQLVNMIPSYVWRLTPDGEPSFFSKRMVDFLGLDVPDIDKPGSSRLVAMIDAVVHPDDAALVEDTLRRCLATGETFAIRCRLRRADGVYRWMSSHAAPSPDDTGRTSHWYGICHDIDEEMRSQEALRERERDLSILVNFVPSNLWRLTPDGETTLANKYMADYLGMNLEDKHQLDVMFDTIFHPDDVEAVWDRFSHCLSTGERFAMRYRLRRHDGAYRWMSGCAEAVRNEDGQIVQWVGLCHDVDDQVHAEDALRRAYDSLARATQAASLAELSASIAHEVNQPLAAILANAATCQHWLSQDPPNLPRAKRAAGWISRDANAAADVVSHIRALFRQAPRSRSLEDINRLVGEVCHLMVAEIAAKGAQIEMTLEPELPPVALDRVQVQQVFVNLIRNGMEAMENVVDHARRIQILTYRDGPAQVRIEVRDAGPGFKDTERVFEPFFTTKKDGLGMGLSICRSIVEAHGGRLWTRNDDKCGAIIAFTLPLEVGECPQPWRDDAVERAHL